MWQLLANTCTCLSGAAGSISGAMVSLLRWSSLQMLRCSRQAGSKLPFENIQMR